MPETDGAAEASVTETPSDLHGLGVADADPSPADTAPGASTGETSGDTYTLTINGESVAVSLDELQKGYLRQADYTRKTQTVAEKAKQLEQVEAFIEALNANPETAIAELQQAYGITGTPGDDSPLDPIDAELGEIKAFMAAQKEAATQAQLDAELASLHETYGDFDEESLFAHAVKVGIPNLEAAFLHLNKPKLSLRQAQAAAADAQETARVAALVSGGHGVGAGSVTSGGTATPQTLREAFELAKKQLNVSQAV